MTAQAVEKVFMWCSGQTMARQIRFAKVLSFELEKAKKVGATINGLEMSNIIRSFELLTSKV